MTKVLCERSSDYHRPTTTGRRLRLLRVLSTPVACSRQSASPALQRPCPHRVTALSRSGCVGVVQRSRQRRQRRRQRQEQRRHRSNARGSGKSSAGGSGSGSEQEQRHAQQIGVLLHAVAGAHGGRALSPSLSPSESLVPPVVNRQLSRTSFSVIQLGGSIPARAANVTVSRRRAVSAAADVPSACTSLLHVSPPAQWRAGLGRPELIGEAQHHLLDCLRPTCSHAPPERERVRAPCSGTVRKLRGKHAAARRGAEQRAPCAVPPPSPPRPPTPPSPAPRRWALPSAHPPERSRVPPGLPASAKAMPCCDPTAPP